MNIIKQRRKFETNKKNEKFLLIGGRMSKAKELHQETKIVAKSSSMLICDVIYLLFIIG